MPLKICKQWLTRIKNSSLFLNILINLLFWYHFFHERLPENFWHALFFLKIPPDFIKRLTIVFWNGTCATNFHCMENLLVLIFSVGFYKWERGELYHSRRLLLITQSQYSVFWFWPAVCFCLCWLSLWWWRGGLKGVFIFCANFLGPKRQN